MAELDFEDKQSEISLRDILFVLFRHVRLIVVTIVICSVAAAAAFMVVGTRKEYLSEAKLMFRHGRESVSVDPVAVAGDTMTRGGRVGGDQIRSAVAIILSHEIAARTVDAVGVDLLLPPQGESKPAIVRQLKRKIGSLWKRDDAHTVVVPAGRQRREAAASLVLGGLDARPVRSSSVLNLTYTAADPKLAQRVLSAVIELYLQKHINLNFNDSSYNFLKQKTDELAAALEQTEQQIKEFKARTGITDADEQSLTEIHTAISQESILSEARLAESRAQVQAIRDILKRMQGASQSADTGHSLAQIQQRIGQLRIEEQELLSTFTEESIPVQEVRRQIREMQLLLPRAQEAADAQPATGDIILSPEIITQLQGQLVTAETLVRTQEQHLRVLNRQLAEVEQQLARLNESALVLVQLQRRREIDASSFQRYAESLEEARIDQALKIEKLSNVSIAQEATLPITPVKSKARLILPLGLIGGVCAGLALAFVREKMDQTIKRPEDVQNRLRLSTLVSIPLNPDCAFVPPLEQMSNLVLMPCETSFSNAAEPSAKHQRIARHYYETLLHRIVVKDEMPVTKSQVLAVTSSRAGEGVTTTALHLAYNLARIGNVRVLLVNLKMLLCDTVTVSESVALQSIGGAATTGEDDDAPLPRKLDQMLMMRAGQTRDGATVSDLQDMWKRDYDFVVVDLPPVYEDSRAELFSRVADKIIMVVEAERERWQVVRAACDVLHNSRAQIAGVVLNRRRTYIPEWIYRRM